jgi:hypothetical protein
MQRKRCRPSLEPFERMGKGLTLDVLLAHHAASRTKTDGEDYEWPIG